MAQQLAVNSTEDWVAKRTAAWYARHGSLKVNEVVGWNATKLPWFGGSVDMPAGTGVISLLNERQAIAYLSTRYGGNTIRFISTNLDHLLDHCLKAMPYGELRVPDAMILDGDKDYEQFYTFTIYNYSGENLAFKISLRGAKNEHKVKTTPDKGVIRGAGEIIVTVVADDYENISDVMDEYLLIEYGRLDSNKDAVYREEYVNPSGWLRPEKLSKEIKLRYR